MRRWQPLSAILREQTATWQSTGWTVHGEHKIIFLYLALRVCGRIICVSRVLYVAYLVYFVRIPRPRRLSLGVGTCVDSLALMM